MSLQSIISKSSYKIVIVDDIIDCDKISDSDITNNDHNNTIKIMKTVKTIILDLKDLDKYFKRRDLKILQTKRLNNII